MTAGELRKFLENKDIKDDTKIVINDAYTGAFVKEFELDYSFNSIFIDVNTNPF